MPLLLLSAPVYGEGIDLTAISDVHWDRGTLGITVKADIGDYRSPGEARVAFEDKLRREIGTIFCEALYDIYLDSYRTIKEALERNNALLMALLDLGNRVAPMNIYLDTTLSTLTATFQFNMYPDIINIFTTHTYPYAPTSLMYHVPTVKYSGIVIYAKGEYPVHGEDPAGKNPEPFHPSIQPKIFDTQMNLVAEAEMMEPEYLSRWGTFGYTDTTDYLAEKERIGATPIFTMARAVFGDYRTDLLIPVDVADQILATPDNRKLIEQGRILIICDLPAAPLID